MKPEIWVGVGEGGRTYREMVSDRKTLMEKDCWEVISWVFMWFIDLQSDLGCSGISRTSGVWRTGKERQYHLNFSFCLDSAWPKFSNGHRIKPDWVPYFLRCLWMGIHLCNWMGTLALVSFQGLLFHSCTLIPSIVYHLLGYHLT